MNNHLKIGKICIENDKTLIKRAIAIIIGITIMATAVYTADISAIGSIIQFIVGIIIYLYNCYKL